jgi:uncharacterized membrane protein
MDEKHSMNSNLAALLSYTLFWVSGILLLAMEKYRKDRLVRFHAYQSIFLSIAYLVFWMIWSRLIWLGFFAPGFIYTVLYSTGVLVFLAFLGLWLFLMYKAYASEMYMIPFIGKMASRRAG